MKFSRIQRLIKMKDSKVLKKLNDLEMKKTICLLIAIQIICLSIHAQTNQVTGVVTDSTGAPIVSATVIEKGRASNGTSTDASGRFTLNLKGNSNVLLFSYIGYEDAEIRVDLKNTMRVILNTTVGSLKDVVVVGYGRQKKITTTGSISTVAGAELRQNPTASLQNTLAGRLPGFFSQQTSGRPGADGATFYIRGVSSYNTGSTSPLIIVDDI